MSYKLNQCSYCGYPHEQDHCPNCNERSELPAPAGSVSVGLEQWAYAVKCMAAIEWLGEQGVCWRDANTVKCEHDWRIGDETEWLYAMQCGPGFGRGDFVDEILRHRKELNSPNAEASDRSN